jgi:hypothetical protein
VFSGFHWTQHMMLLPKASCETKAFKSKNIDFARYVHQKSEFRGFP